MTERETFMWLDGAECELRPISAAAFIGARQEAKALEAVYGDDGETRELLLGACLAARGVYADGERRFERGEEALKALTAEALLSLAAEYALPEAKKAPEETKEESAPQRVRQETDERDQERAKSRTAETQDVMTLRRLPEEPASVTLRGGRPSLVGTEEDASEADAGYRFERDETAAPARELLRSVSDLLERDSRRYDAAFERY